MGAAEVIAFEDVRARKQWATLRQHLHECFDQWLNRLEEPLHESAPTLSAVTETVWHIRQELTGSLTETIIAHVHQGEYTRPQAHCPHCDRRLQARACPAHRRDPRGVRPSGATLFLLSSLLRGAVSANEVLGLSPRRVQLDVQKAAAKLVTEVPYDEAQRLFRDLTGVGVGSERMHKGRQSPLWRLGAGLRVGRNDPGQALPGQSRPGPGGLETDAGAVRRSHKSDGQLLGLSR